MNKGAVIQGTHYTTTNPLPPSLGHHQRVGEFKGDPPPPINMRLDSG